MKAYLIATETVKDEAMFAKYRQEVMPTVAPYDAKFIVRGGTLSVLEGEWPDPRVAIIEFPSAAEDWYRSDAYQKIIGLRLNRVSVAEASAAWRDRAESKGTKR